MNLTTLISLVYISLILIALFILNDIESAIISMIIGVAMIAFHEYGSDEMKKKLRDFYD